MLNTRLIILDGITGSGKSTSAQFLAGQIQALNIDCKWYHEEELPHPLESRFDVNALKEHEVQPFMEETVGLWQQFAERVQDESRSVYIIESIMLQDTARVLFQNNVTSADITALLNRVLEICSGLNPVIIYLWQEDVEASLCRIWEQRGSRWKEWCVRMDSQAPYSRALPLDEVGKTISLWRDYQAFALSFTRQLSIPVLFIENSRGEWPLYRRQMTDFLDVPCVEPTTSYDLDAYVGRFSGQARGREIWLAISRQGDRLQMDNNFLWPVMNLLPEGEDRLTIESLPQSLCFSRDASGEITHITLEGQNRWSGAVLHPCDKGETRGLV